MIYDEFGDELHTDFASVEAKLAARLADWGSEDGGEEEDEDAPKRTLPEKKKRKLLDAKTWERDGRLVETADAASPGTGRRAFEDHNVFRREVAMALDRELERKVSAADLKAILNAVSWRVETAPPVVAKTHKPGKVEADRFMAFTKLRSKASNAWWSTNRTANCATPSRFRSLRRRNPASRADCRRRPRRTKASSGSFAARCCPTCPTRGFGMTGSRLRDQLYAPLL